jgi:hypothetical protein
MSETFSDLHVTMTWIAGIIAGLTLILLLVGSLRRQTYGALMSGMMLAFSGAATLQWLVGLGLVLSTTPTAPPNWGHILPMTAAALVSHLYHRWNTAEDVVRYRTSLFVLVIVLALVAAGITFLYVD